MNGKKLIDEQEAEWEAKAHQVCVFSCFVVIVLCCALIVWCCSVIVVFVLCCVATDV